MDIIYGACGVENCTDCRPLYDSNNQPIPGTDDLAVPVQDGGSRPAVDA